MKSAIENYGMFLSKRNRVPGAYGVVVFLLAVTGFLATAGLPVLGYLSAAEIDRQLVDQEWLAGEMGRPDLVLLDTRPRDAYLKQHIKGAANLPVRDTFGEDPRSDLAAPISRIQALFSAAGIDQLTRVVLYDDGDMINAARVFWILEMHGHRRVSLLSPGFREWIAAGLPADAQLVTPPPRRFLSHVTPDRLATKLSTRLAIDDPDTVIIDARKREEYLGVESKSKRYGHIPTAISIPYEENFTGDGKTLRPFAELQEVYRRVPRNKKVIAYCNKGRHSALTYFILRQLGYDVSAYDGSWFEWSNDLQLPIERHARVKPVSSGPVSD